MKILFDIGHPAHVHLFKNLILYFKKRGHEITVVSRDKDITVYLLNHYEISHIVISKANSGLIGALFEFIQRTLKIIKLHKKYYFDIAIGTSVSIGYLSLFFKVKSYIFCEDDDDVVQLFVLFTYPFATKIISPACLKFKYFKNKRILYNSYQKLAYLHPDEFKPNKNILKKYGLKPNKYIILRLSALKAHHDLKAKGINVDIIKRIMNICDKYTIIFSKENVLTKIKPWDMHHLLNYAKLIISDSQSMTVEAAMLGVPSIRFGIFKNKLSVLNEIENKYKLSYSFYPNQTKIMYQKISEILQNSKSTIIYNKKKLKLIKEKENLNKWFKNYFIKNIEK